MTTATQNQTHVRVVTGVIPVTLDGVTRYFMQQRTPSRNFPWLWECPGGKVEPDDASLVAALHRELDEELALAPADCLIAAEPFLITTFRKGEIAGIERDYTLHFFHVEVSPEVAPVGARDALGHGWFTLDQMHAMRGFMIPGNVRLLDRLRPATAPRDATERDRALVRHVVEIEAGRDGWTSAEIDRAIAEIDRAHPPAVKAAPSETVRTDPDEAAIQTLNVVRADHRLLLRAVNVVAKALGIVAEDVWCDPSVAVARIRLVGERRDRRIWDRLALAARGGARGAVVGRGEAMNREAWIVKAAEEYDAALRGLDLAAEEIEFDDNGRADDASEARMTAADVRHEAALAALRAALALPAAPRDATERDEAMRVLAAAARAYISETDNRMLRRLWVPLCNAVNAAEAALAHPPAVKAAPSEADPFEAMTPTDDERARCEEARRGHSFVEAASRSKVEAFRPETWLRTHRMFSALSAPPPAAPSEDVRAWAEREVLSLVERYAYMERVAVVQRAHDGVSSVVLFPNQPAEVIVTRFGVRAEADVYADLLEDAVRAHRDEVLALAAAHLRSCPPPSPAQPSDASEREIRIAAYLDRFAAGDADPAQKRLAEALRCVRDLLSAPPNAFDPSRDALLRKVAEAVRDACARSLRLSAEAKHKIADETRDLGTHHSGGYTLAEVRRSRAEALDEERESIEKADLAAIVADVIARAGAK